MNIISCLVIFLFVYTGSSKLIDYEKFRLELGKSPLLTHIARFVAVGVPLVELTVAGLLAWGRTRLKGLSISFTLMVMFSAYLVAILRFSFYVPCTCGGVLQSMNWDTHLIFNGAYILIIVAAIILSPRVVTFSGKSKLSQVQK